MIFVLIVRKFIRKKVRLESFDIYCSVFPDTIYPDWDDID